jgi:hypothetical protein
MAERGDDRAHLAHGRGIERVLLALHPTASSVTESAIALRHKPPHPDRLRCRKKVIGALGPEAVGRREIALHVTRVDGTDRGELMDDHVRLGSRHGLRDLAGIKRVRDHRHGAQLLEHRLLRLALRMP